MDDLVHALPTPPHGVRRPVAREWLAAGGDPELEALVRVAAALTGAAMATVNVFDSGQMCHLGPVGFAAAPSPAAEAPCTVRLAQGGSVHVPDTLLEEDFRTNAWVDGRRGALRFYASVPLVPPGAAEPLGTLCVLDVVPRTLTEDQLARLEDVAVAVVAVLERRRAATAAAATADAADEQRELTELLLAELTSRTEEMEVRSELLQTVLDTIDVSVVAADAEGHLTLFNRASREWHGLTLDPAMDPRDHAARYQLFEADGRTPLAVVPLHAALAGDPVEGVEIVIAPDDRPSRRVVVSGRRMTSPDGRPLGAVVVQADVTADRAHRAEMERVRAELERRGRALEREVAGRRATQDQLAALNGELQRMLLLDGLTGLANRPCLDDHLGRAWRASRRRGGALSVLMVDVDHFKAYNDTNGHLAGDECLRQVATCLAEVCERGGDLVARYGGEEFAVVLADTDAAGAAVVGQRLVEAVRALGLPHAGRGPESRVTISVGAATVTTPYPLAGADAAGAGAAAAPTGDTATTVLDSTLSAQVLLQAADTALYAAKSAGRDRSRHVDDLPAAPPAGALLGVPRPRRR